MRRSLVALLGLRSGLSLAAAPSSGNHPEWPRWCGKAYQPQYPSFDPGGQTVEPPALPGGPALDVQFKPRYSIYLESEAEAEFVVDAAISRWRGQPWPDLGSPDKAPAVRFTIALTTGDVLVSDTVPAGSRSNLFAFRLAGLRPRLEPYEVVLMGDGGGGERNLTARSELFVLPEKKTGSVSRLDNVNGGILFRGRATGGAFEPFLPHGFYASCDNFLCDADRLRKIRAYAGLGLNSLVSLTTVAASGDTYRELDRLDLRFMYDLRDFYKNVTAVREQVAAVRDFDALYAYWGADEPDGHQDPFPLVVEAREAIRSVDPYHPVSVTLNCQDYYFGQYSAGADIVMEDAYPVGINSSFSKWGTACNATYGDCGCDNCAGDVGDVARRLDRLARHERRLGLWPKTKAHNPQSFHGEGYWSRDPTPAEETAMSALALHHGAKALAAWLWPTSESLARASGALARAVAGDPSVRDLVVRGRARPIQVARSADPSRRTRQQPIDAAYWEEEEALDEGEGAGGRRMLVSVVNAGDEAVDGPVAIPVRASALDRVVWGNGTWTVADDGGVRLGGATAMSTNMILLRGAKGRHG